MSLLPKHLEQELISFVKANYLPKRFQNKKSLHSFNIKDLKFFAPAVADLSESFTSERNLLPKNYFNQKEFRSAYLLYFFLTNYAKVKHCLLQLLSTPQQNSPLNKAEISVLDVGAGPGNASLACADFFAEHFAKTKLEITALEQSRTIASDARALFAKLNKSALHKFKAIAEHATAGSLSRVLRQKQFDVIVAANIFNEFRSRDEAVQFASALLDRLHEGGLLIIIDPALQTVTRNLMELRNQLLNTQAGKAKSKCAVIAPCLHQNNCPMLEHNKRDWCHFYIEWDCPQIIRELDSLIGNRHDYLKMAYLIMQKTNTLPQAKLLNNRCARVVSSPLKSKGKTELLLCSGAGEIERATQLDRTLAKKQAAFLGTKRGDIVKTEQNGKLTKLQNWNR